MESAKSVRGISTKRSFIVVWVALLLVAAACGGSGDGVADTTVPTTGSVDITEPTQTTEPAPAPDTTEGPGEPIRIGFSLSATGSLATTAAETEAGYQLWAEDANASGGLGGRQVEFVVYDDQSDPATGARNYERLINEDGVELVFGPFSSGVTSAVAPVLEREGFPIVAAGASARDIWEQGYTQIFGISAGGTQITGQFIDLANHVGVDTLALITNDTAYGLDIGESGQEYAADQGIEVAIYEEFPAFPTDFSGIIARIAQEAPMFLLAGTYYEESVLLAQQSEDQNLAVPYVAHFIGPDTESFIEALGEAAEGYLSHTQFDGRLAFEGASEFAEKFEAEYGRRPSYQAALAYASGEILQDAFELAGISGNIDEAARQALRDALAELETQTIAGTYRVDDTGAQVGKEAFITQIQDGAHEIVWPLEFATADIREKG